MSETNYRKKLIEVALPLEAINVASAREKSIRHGHPSTLHLWWARRPLATARAVIFAQMVDDPSSRPELFPTEEIQDAERQRLFRIIENLVKWENTTNEVVLEQARQEIRNSWRLTCEDNKDHPRTKELFDPENLPAFHDPFAGGGALPLEAQRLGLETHASDLNPVAVLINKAMIEIPPKFAGQPPVNSESRKRLGQAAEWKGAAGLADDVRYYGQWMRDEAEKRIGHLYPKVEVSAEMARERPDLKQYLGKKLTVIAWLWARTVKSPNPAFSDIDVPLVSNFVLSNRPGKEAYIEPLVRNGEYQFVVKRGVPPDPESAKHGTSAGKRRGFTCLFSGTPIPYQFIRAEGSSGRIGARLMAIIAKGDGERLYISASPEHETIARQATPTWIPEIELPNNPRDFKTPNYGLVKFGDLFTSRQLIALTTISELIGETQEQICRDAIDSRLSEEATHLRDGGTGSLAYSEAVVVYLSIALSRLTDICNALCRWEVSRTQVRNLFGRQAIPMIWDYAENNVFGNAAGDYSVSLGSMVNALEKLPVSGVGIATQSEAQSQSISVGKIVSADPPYYDNIGYAELSDFFYIWLRRSLRDVYPDLFATIAVPKNEELIATPYRHGSKEEAERFFLDGMTKAMQRLADQTHPAFPVTIYYAFKQSESQKNGHMTRTGWEAFLDAVISAGFMVSGTWPMRTELSNRMIGAGKNALASSIVLVCRKRLESSTMATRGEFLGALRHDLGERVRTLKSGSIAPVDLPQSCIGPGMEIFTRYYRVLEANGSPMSVGAALSAINEVLDEVQTEQEGEYDPATRFAISWFEQNGMRQGDFGEADNLARARDIAVNALERAGIVEAGGGNVRLLRPSELSEGWTAAGAGRLTIWEAAHRLILAHDSGGVDAAGLIVAQIGGGISDRCRDLAYRLYSVCERQHWAEDAVSYNALVSAWPAILSAAERQRGPVQASF